MSGLLNKLDVQSDSDETLFLALSLPFQWSPKGASHWSAEERDGKQQITLYCYEMKGAVRLPFRLDTPKKMTQFVRGWLDDAQYGVGHGGDGTDKKGWRIYIDDHFSFCSIQAAWNYYSK